MDYNDLVLFVCLGLGRTLISYLYLQFIVFGIQLFNGSHKVLEKALTEFYSLHTETHHVQPDRFGKPWCHVEIKQ